MTTTKTFDFKEETVITYATGGKVRIQILGRHPNGHGWTYQVKEVLNKQYFGGVGLFGWDTDEFFASQQPEPEPTVEEMVRKDALGAMGYCITVPSSRVLKALDEAYERGKSER